MFTVTNKGWYLFAAQLAAHLSIPVMIAFARPAHYGVALAVYFFTGCLGMSMTYHRLWSHKSWQAPKWFAIFGTLCAAIGLTGSPLAWAAVHRAHHSATDKVGDPHSPQQQSFWSVQYLSMFAVPNLKLCGNLLQLPYLKFIHRRYFHINLTYAAAVALADPFAFVYAYLFPAAILWNAGSLINNLGHTWGYRNYETSDRSRNNPLLGYLMWGEGWHNNHHRAPAKANFSTSPLEFDLSYRLIKLLNRP